MTEPTDFNDLDRALRRLFEDSAPPAGEPAPLVLERIGPRLTWARRRRVAGQAGAAVAAAVGAIGLGVALIPSDPAPETIVMADGGDAPDTGVAVTGAAVDADNLGGPVPDEAPTTIAPTTAPPSSPAPAAAPPGTVAPTTATPTTAAAPTTTNAPEPVDTVFSTTGGSVTVRWTPRAMELLSVDPEPGYEYEVGENKPTSIEVEFRRRGDEDSSDIELELVDGELVQHS